MKIHISPSRALPADTPARTIAVFGQKGSGKTYLAMVLAEGMLEAGAQIVCLDPTGVWWGLKAEGTGPGFPILVMGGDHGDVPLAYTSGTIVADFVVKSGQSVVLDLSHFESNAQQDRFVSDFAERLYRAMSSERRPIHVMMDEADSFAPQNPRRGGLEPRMLGAIETIVRRGRSRGLGMTMITQRPAVLNKNVVEQADLIIATRIVGKNDHAALNDMTRLRASKEQTHDFLSALPALANGYAYFWSPEWLDCFTPLEILKKRTFDSSKTPTPGEKRKAPKLAAIDLDKLTAEIQATVDSAKDNDPRALKAENAVLRANLVKLETEIQRMKDAPVEVAHISPDEMDQLCMIRRELETANRDVLPLLQKLTLEMKPPQRADAFRRPAVATPPAPQKMRVPTAPPAPINGKGSLTAGERAVLVAIAQTQGTTREHIGILTGYKRSSRDTYLQKLKQKECVLSDGENILITGQGLKLLGDFEALPTGSDLQRYWMERLTEGERRVLSYIVACYPEPVPREKIDETTGYKRSSRDTYLQKLIARKLLTAPDRGTVAANPILFD